jgi:hypothetical protein
MREDMMAEAYSDLRAMSNGNRSDHRVPMKM